MFLGNQVLSNEEHTDKANFSRAVNKLIDAGKKMEKDGPELR